MLNNEFPPLGGGTATANRALLQHFARVADLEIDLITSALRDKNEQEEFSKHITIFKVPVRNKDLHHSSNRELLSYAARAFPLALRGHHTRRYDFCFAWSAVPAGFIALVLRKCVGLPYLVRVGGADIPGFERRYNTIYPILSPLIYAIWHSARAVVVKSEGEREMILSRDSRVKIALVPNGVHLHTFEPSGPIPEHGPLRLLCVARLIERKGQHHLIESVKRLTDGGVNVSLDIVGTGDARLTYERQAQKLGLNGKVVFRGYVPREQIAEHYTKAHVFVLPSFNEGMSIAILEAMAAGLPVITTTTGGTKELVEEGVNGWTHAWGDIDTLTERIKRLAINRTLARHMGMASRHRAAQFSWDRGAALYLELFKQLVTRGSSPHVETERALT